MIIFEEMKVMILALTFMVFSPDYNVYCQNNSVTDSTGMVGSNYTIAVNNLSFQMSNSGDIGFVDFRDNSVLFSAGFLLSGRFDSFFWLSGSASSERIKSYFSPGSIFIVKSTDEPFGKSWNDWRQAVESGALYYDGDKDGVYNPKDKNFNGIWDQDEDMPYLLGDVTAYCNYDEFTLHGYRSPHYINVQQYIFVSDQPHLSNTFFVLYSFNTQNDVQDTSVYFSIYADPDIGDHTDDLAGCDTLLSSGFVYNNGEDQIFGSETPAVFATLLQGPKVSVKDYNDFKAVNRFGVNYGESFFEGFINEVNKSFQSYNLENMPVNEVSYYNKIRGFNNYGLLFDPCTYEFGYVIPDTICDKVNPKFLFSGDPLSNSGWINNFPSDQRFLLSSGPFTLNATEPQMIIVAYTIGSGDNYLNSIRKGKDLIPGIINEYESNFASLTYQSGEPLYPVVDYYLYQNYPNPFNASTLIRYELPDQNLITIKIYDLLGREIKTLINDFKLAGRYEVEFDGSNLASGIYFYKIQAGEFVQTRKMVLLK
jgi:hypothetical protein